MENVLEYKGVTKKYGAKVALDNIDLALPKGSIVGLLGPNGSGKTTMLKLAAGLLTKNRGEISVCGLKPGAEAKNLIAYQPDKIYINDWMTLNNLMKMMEDFYTNFNRTKALDMIERLGLNPKERIKSMSKGNKEKVQLIITMSRDVPLYLLDDPIGGVDPAARDYILNTILGNYNPEATIVISPHLIADVESILNHIVFIKKGKIIRNGNAEQIRAETGMTIDELFREEFKC